MHFRFRETFGGLHLKYGVNPDIAIFAKALATDTQLHASLASEI